MNKITLAAIGATVLGTATVSANSSALAFYSFKDGAAGSSAASAALVNSIAPSTLGGTVTLNTNDASAAAAFDADAPGVRIYSSYRPDAELLCVAPQSIDISSDSTSSSGARGASIVFAGAGTELSRHHGTGFTVEYFFKIENDAVWNGYGSKANLSIYKDASSGAIKTFNLHLPYNNATTVRCGVGGYTSSYPMYAENKNLTAVNDGKWHHVAIVQTTDGNLEVYYDRTRYINVAVPASLLREEVAADATVILACQALAGKISCVRLTARALDKDDFLYVSKREQVVTDDGVLAFYPFDDGTVGTSAVGTNKVCDAVNPVHCPGHVGKASSGSPSITWDNDRPGTYIYAGKNAWNPIYVSPGSIHVTSGTTGASGTIKFYGLGADLNACRGKGHTIEYFMKLDDSDFTSTGWSLRYSAGYFYEGEAGKPFTLYIPFSMAYSEGRQFRYSIGAYNGGHALSPTLPFYFWDGRWHHVAVVQYNDVTAGEGGAVTTNRAVRLYVDGTGYNSLSFDGIAESVASGDFELGNYVHHGKYSCLKVTNRALSPEEFLYATDKKRKGIIIGFK